MTTQKACRMLLPALLLTLVATSHSLAQKTAPKTATAKDGNGTVQRDVARIQVVEGNVLVSQEAGLAAIEGTGSLQEGTRVITTAGSRASIVFTDGCVVELNPNQRVAIDSSRPCKERIATVESILLDGPGSTTLAGGGAGGTGGAGESAAALGGSTLGGSTGAAGAGTTVAGGSGAVGLLGAAGGLAGGPLGAVAGLAGLGGLAAAARNRGQNTASPN